MNTLMVTWNDLYELREKLQADSRAAYEEAARPIRVRYEELMAPAVEIMYKYMMYAEPDFMNDFNYIANAEEKRFDEIHREARAVMQETRPHFKRLVDTTNRIDMDFKRAVKRLRGGGLNHER